MDENVKCKNCIFFSKTKLKDRNISLRHYFCGYCTYPKIKKSDICPLGNCEYFLPLDIGTK